MKTITATCVILLIFNAFLYGQTEFGTSTFSGNASINKELTKGNTYTNFSINPSAAYAIANGFFLGINPSYSYTSFSNNGRSYSFGIDPFLRYYILNKKERWAWFIQANYTFYRSRFRFNQIESTDDSQSFSGGFGHNYFLNSHIAIEGILQYRYNKYKERDDRNVFYYAGLRFFLPPVPHDTNLIIGKGTKLIGLDINGGWANIGETDNFYFSIYPTLGFFITDHLVLGSSLWLAFADENSIFEPQPFARYYFGNLNNKIRPFLYAGLNTRFQFADKSTESSFFNLDVNAGIGADFFLTRNVALEGLLQFNGNQIEDETFNRNFLNFNIGFQFFLS